MIKKLFLMIVLMSIVSMTTIGCSCGGGSSQKSKIPTIDLVMWGVLDDESVYKPIIENYKNYVKNEANVNITYVKKDYADYENETLSALAAGKGPDIWIMKNDEVYKNADKLVPVSKNLLKKSANDSRTNVEIYEDMFPPVAVQDNVIDNEVYGIPFSIDTLVVYYNTGHFSRTMNDLYKQDRANDADFFRLPPNNWEEFLKVTELLTQKDDKGNIIRAGAALGTAANVEHSTDILAAMMIQNQTKMVSADLLTATFSLPITKDSGEPSYAGTQALNFYTSFADPTKENYMWNDSMPNSVEAFIKGKASMMIHYGYIRKRIEQEAPSLNYKIIPFPQISGSVESVDFASYWTNTVTNNSKNPDQAWDFIKYTYDQELQTYLNATQKPSAKKVNNLNVPLTKERIINSNPLGYQIMTAKYWYRGKYPVKVANAFYQMIQSVVVNKEPLQKAIDKAASTVTELYKASATSQQ